MHAEVLRGQTNPTGRKAKTHADFVRQSCAGDWLGAPAEPYVIAAWERCLGDYQLEPSGDPPGERVDNSVLEERRALLGPLAQIVRAEMRRLFGQIAPSHYLLLFTDADGVILERMCEPGHEELLHRVDLAPGFIWDERHEGANGPGTCLHDRRPRLVHRAEHFFARNVRMTCSAAPLWGPNGQLLGALDTSHFDCPDSRESQLPTLAMVTTSTRLVEQSYFTGSFKDCWILRFHDQTDMVNQLHAGMLAVDEHGMVRAADSTAPARLGLDGYDSLVGRGIDELFDISISRFFNDAQVHPYQVGPAAGRNGNMLYVGIWPPQEPPPAARHGRSLAPPAVQQARAPVPHLGDPVVAHNMWCAEQVMNRDIHILLQGETGTGKDTFARMIHQRGERREKTFLALSCAAIPETLIESELFGYDPGAFTGARVGGMRGKVVAAHGGTLFLDEIGDMPLGLQARLLRLLEDKEVTPLGRSRPIAVDIRVISATNRDLGRMVLEGNFRKDLYYRLSGLALTMPSLRERHDIEKLIHAIAAEENGGVAVVFAPEAFAALRTHSWPGNIRELRNTLATAIALSGGRRIEREHLGPGFGGRPLPETVVVEDASPLAAAERDRLLQELKRRHWNATATAGALGISRNTLYRKLRKHGIRVGAEADAEE
ncbi:MAG TPA: sigma-54-dependent Fis family transcriptional regulator [Acetobacteraceae bacterium]|nr:sigma-54-dependent Fis family transcriptional regulator [Acetobacteraceae bacterium]